MEVDPSLPEDDWRSVREQIDAILSARDTTTQLDAVAVLARTYDVLDDDGRARFLRSVADGFGVDSEALRSAARAAGSDPTDARLQVALRQALTPRFAELLHLVTALDGGVKLLVDLRDDVRRLARQDVPLLDLELSGHLATLFDVGLLELRRITWDSPASLLEKLIEYEAVHEIDGWDDLRDRLDTDRRCYAFLHPAMPGEPVVFVEIALVIGPPTSLAEILDREAPSCDPAVADTAVFYSITSCQAGLSGINLGNALIKTVVGELRRALPQLERFVTLSPIPSLRDADLDLDRRCFAFLHPAMPGEPVVFVEIALVTGPPTSLGALLDRTAPACDPADADTAVFYSITSCQAGLAGINLGNALLKEVVAELRRQLPNLERFVTLSPIPSLRDADLRLPDDVRVALADDRWLGDPEREAMVRDPLLRATAAYLTTAVDGRVGDPVANFHLSNGASVDAVRWLANTEDYGLQRSWGIMASYRYDPSNIATNAETYASGTVVPTSDEVRALADGQRTQGGASSGSTS